MMRGRTFFRVVRTAAALLVLAGAAAAAPPGGERGYHLDNEFWTRLAKDAGGVLASPFSWKPVEVLGCTAVLGVSGLMYVHDADIQEWAQGLRTPTSDGAMAIIERGGDAAYLTAFLAALYAAGEIAPSRGLRKTAVLGLESLAVTGAVVLGLKCLLGRARPDLGLPSNHFEPFTLKSGYMSLPSGHTAAAFAVATSLACRLDGLLGDALLYAMAGAVAVSRVHDNKHWASDVLLGAVLGHVIALKVAELNKGDEVRVRVSASIAPGSLGLAFRF